MELTSTAASPVFSSTTTPSAMFLNVTTSQIIVANNIITTTNSNVISEEERQRYLDQLQHETTITLIPSMIYLVALGVTGVVGNTLVLLVYTNSKKFKRNATSIFIMVIAALDLITDIVTIPTQIVDKLHSWDFNNRPLCRARQYYNAFTALGSGMVLVAVAFARYRKVCAPYGWQVSIRHAKIISVVITLLGMIFAIPYAITNGRQTKKTPRDGIYGYECTTDDNYKGTIWPTMNNAFFLLLFLVCSTTLTVLYIRIGIQAKRHSRLHGVAVTSQVPMTPTFSPISETADKKNGRSASKFHIKSKKTDNSISTLSFQYSGDTCSSKCSTEETKKTEAKVNVSLDETKEIHDGNDFAVCPSENVNNSAYRHGNDKPQTTNDDARCPLPKSTSKESNTQTGGARRRPLGRTTAKLIIISVVFIVGFIPYLTIQFLRFSSPEKYAKLNMVEMSLVRLCLNSFLLNCAANPVVYSLCDVKFRQECLRLLKCCSRQ